MLYAFTDLSVTYNEASGTVLRYQWSNGNYKWTGNSCVNTVYGNTSSTNAAGIVTPAENINTGNYNCQFSTDLSYVDIVFTNVHTLTRTRPVAIEFSIEAVNSNFVGDDQIKVFSYYRTDVAYNWGLSPATLTMSGTSLTGTVVATVA